jgi:hypothetical protein
MNESDARALVQSLEQSSVGAIERLGDVEEIPEEAEVAIEDCLSDIDGSHLGSGMIVSRSSWNVQQDGGPGLAAVEAALTDESMVVAPYDEQTRKLTATQDDFRVVLAFWQTPEDNGRIDLTVMSPCIDGIA